MAAVTHGGFGRAVELDQSASDQRQIDLAVAAGQEPEFAERFVKALVVGGETDAGGLDLIKQRALSNHSDHVVGDHADLPVDWFFRNAWRLDATTGNVFVDIEASRNVFVERLVRQKSYEIGKLVEGIEAAILLGKPDSALEALHLSLKEMDLHALGDLVRKADAPETLKALWPEGLRTGLED